MVYMKTTNTVDMEKLTGKFTQDDDIKLNKTSMKSKVKGFNEDKIDQLGYLQKTDNNLR